MGNNPFYFTFLVSSDIIPELLQIAGEISDGVTIELAAFMCRQLAETVLIANKFRDISDLIP